jgi:NAD-dependent deacetylase
MIEKPPGPFDPGTGPGAPSADLDVHRAAAELARRLGPAVRLTVMTGAGVSAASGVPTFRGPEGLWKRYRPEQLATPDAFARDPRLVWEWYDWRRQVIARCHPNRAHEVLAAWARRFTRAIVVTQNVDGLHERAGLVGVVRLHGSIWEVFCSEACPGSPPRWRDERVPLPDLPPPCPYCGGHIRPGVVWFGEALPADAVARADAATTCDVFVAAGTSALVYPAAGFLPQARRRGAFTVEINPAATEASASVDLVIRAGAEVALDAVERHLAAHA